MIAELLAPRFTALGFEVQSCRLPRPAKRTSSRACAEMAKRPVLLASHGDTVGVERDKWSVDPFAGAVRGGYVLGRGAHRLQRWHRGLRAGRDALAENKVPLARDVIFLVEADEEAAATTLRGWPDHWAKIDCRVCAQRRRLDHQRPRRPGEVRQHFDRRQVVVVRHRDGPGTSTIRRCRSPDSAIFALANALARLSTYETEVQLSPLPGFLRDVGKIERATRRWPSHFRTSRATIRRACSSRSGDQPRSATACAAPEHVAPVLLNAGFRGNVFRAPPRRRSTCG